MIYHIETALNNDIVVYVYTFAGEKTIISVCVVIRSSS